MASMTADEVRAEVRAWLDEHHEPDVGGRAWLEKVVDAGWAVPSWPTDVFGRGLSPEVGRVVNEEFRRSGAAGSGQDVVNLWAATVATFGTDELKAEFVRPMLLGEVNMCLLYSEPGAGSDLAGVQTRATRDGDEWVISGQKVWTSMGRNADHAFLIARTDSDVPKHRGMSFFFFPMKQDGVEVRALRQATGDSRFNEVFLSDARVPHNRMLGDTNNGWRVLQTALAYERAAMGQAAKRRKDQDASEAVRDVDNEASAPIPDLHLVDLAQDMHRNNDPVTRQKLTELHGIRKTNEWNGQRGKAALKQGTSSPTVSLGKLAMSRILHTAASKQAGLLGAEAMLGGHDSTRGADTSYALLNAFFTSIGGGTDQIQKNIIGERILGLPKEPEVDKHIPFKDVQKS